MPERETKEITTPINSVPVKLYTYLTGGEKLDIAESEGGSVRVMKTLGLVVVSPTVEEIRAMHGKDFDFVLDAVNNVVNDSSLSSEKKK